MKKSLLKVSFISILAIIICGSAFGVSGTVFGPGGVPGGDGDNCNSRPVPGSQLAPVPLDDYLCTMIPSGGFACCPSSADWVNEDICFHKTLCPSNSHFNNYPLGAELPSNSIMQKDIIIDLCECDSGYVATYNACGELMCVESSEPTPSRTPKRIAKNETNPECDDTTLGTASGSTDFEADWTANTINITWVGNGATINDGASTCTYDQSFNLPTTPTKTGYNFAGWKVVSQ